MGSGHSYLNIYVAESWRRRGLPCSVRLWVIEGMDHSAPRSVPGTRIHRVCNLPQYRLLSIRLSEARKNFDVHWVHRTSTEVWSVFRPGCKCDRTFCALAAVSSKRRRMKERELPAFVAEAAVDQQEGAAQPAADPTASVVRLPKTHTETNGSIRRVTKKRSPPNQQPLPRTPDTF